MRARLAAAIRWLRGLRGLRRWLTLTGLFAVLGIPTLIQLDFTRPLSEITDVDGLMKLRGIASDPSLGALLGYFIGDDPQRSHAFRPLPAATLWVDFHLWGFTRWPYLVVNYAWFVATGLALTWLCRRIGMPALPALACGAVLMALPTRTVTCTVGLLATRGDVMCTLFAALAAGMTIRYVRAGGPRDLWAAAGLSLLAYLSKEMALALAPLSVALTLIFRRDATRPRMLRAVAVAGLMAGAWLVWYRLAEMNMPPAGHGSHSLEGLATLLVTRWRTSAWMLTAHLCAPLAQLQRQISLIGLADCLIYFLFWPQVARMALFVLGLCLLWIGQPRWLAVLYAWKLITYLPVLPLSETWPWYRFMPTLLDPILPVGAVWVALHRREFARLLPSWHRRRAGIDSDDTEEDACDKHPCAARG